MNLFSRVYRAVAKLVANLDRLAKTPTGLRIAGIADKAGKVISVASIFFAALLWVLEAPDRAEARHNAAWSLIAASQGKIGGFGRRGAVESLNRDGVSLAGINLNGAKLRHVELPGADLEGASFAGADLYQAVFACGSYRKLVDWLFSRPTCGTQLSDAKFIETYLVGADLSGSYMGKVTIQRGDYFETKFQGAILDHATLIDVTISCGDFSSATLSYVIFHSALFLPCRGPDGKFQTPPNFVDAKFFEVDLQGTQIEPAWLKSAILCHVKMSDGSTANTGCAAFGIREKTPDK